MLIWHPYDHLKDLSFVQLGSNRSLILRIVEGSISLSSECAYEFD